MQAQEHRLDALTNNLANVDLNGYKRDVSVEKAFPELLIRRFDRESTYSFPLGSVDTAPVVGTLGTGVEYNETFTVWEQGSLKETSNPFDLALESEGFFAVETNDGERYTRNGNFVLGKEGYLLTKDGFFVQGENGPIQIKKNNFTIDKMGRVWQNADLADDPSRLVSLEENDWANTELVDTLKIVTFKRPRHLMKQGNSFWASTEISGEAHVAQGAERPGVLQGFLEGSNVNSVKEMVNMIEVNRAYEANQKVITTQDTLLDKLINGAARY